MPGGFEYDETVRAVMAARDLAHREEVEVKSEMREMERELATVTFGAVRSAA